MAPLPTLVRRTTTPVRSDRPPVKGALKRGSRILEGGPELVEEIVGLCAAGYPAWRISAEVGVPTTTFFSWIEFGRRLGAEAGAAGKVAAAWDRRLAADRAETRRTGVNRRYGDGSMDPDDLRPQMGRVVAYMRTRGYTLGRAARQAGYDPGKFWRWYRRGADYREGPFFEFRQEVNDARDLWRGGDRRRDGGGDAAAGGAP